jgi:dienelactone hydrolase
VGRTRVDLVDYSRIDRSSPKGTTAERELVVWLWYPAAPADDSMRAAYLPAGWDACDEIMGISLGTRALASHAFTDAPVNAAAGPYPVLLFSPMGFSPLSYAAITEELASNGYVVASICHTFESPVTVFADGRSVPANGPYLQGIGAQVGEYEDVFRYRAGVAEFKSEDMRFVASTLSSWPLATVIDVDRLGAFGHSLGGNAAFEFCRSDERCRAAVNLDGGIWSEVGRVGLPKPSFVLMTEHPEMDEPAEALVAAGLYPSIEWCLAERAVVQRGWQVVAETGRPNAIETIAGARHVNFVDLQFIGAPQGSLMHSVIGSIEPVSMWRQTCDHLLGFFEEHLR